MWQNTPTRRLPQRSSTKQAQVETNEELVPWKRTALPKKIITLSTAFRRDRIGDKRDVTAKKGTPTIAKKGGVSDGRRRTNNNENDNNKKCGGGVDVASWVR